MRTLLPVFFLTVCASAQVFEAGAHGGVSRISGKQLGTLPGSTGENVPVTLDDGWRFGFRITLNNWSHFGHEFGYGYNRTTLRIEDTPPTEGGMAIHQGFYNFLLYPTPEGSPIRPFSAVGGHFSNYVPPGASVTSGGGSNKIGYNYGGGLKVRIMPNWGLRFDVRQYVTGKPFDLPNASGLIRQLEMSVGFMFML
jgi:opacity protein-like surface antigen